MTQVIKPRIGERILFRVDRLSGQRDVLPLDETLRACLPETPAQVELTILDRSDRERKFTLDNLKGYITGRGLTTLIGEQNYLSLEILDEDERRYRISEWVIQSEEEEVPFEDSYVRYDEANQDVLDRLSGSVFDSYVWYGLNRRAQSFSASAGFDTLISIGVMRDVVLYQHQLNAVSATLRRFRGRVLLCDEVGLGKTIEAGMILLEYIMRRMVKKVLILTPPSLTTQWQEEMRHKFGFDFVLHDESEFRETGKDAWGIYDYVIASIDTAKRQEHAEHIQKIYYDMVIVDEAHHLKNRNTVAWKFVDSLKKRYILLLTATPVQNELSELFNLITLLKPGLLSTSRSFTKNFVARGDRMTPKNLPYLRSLLANAMIRNRRSSTDVRFTKRFAHTIKVELTQSEMDFYHEMTEFVRTEHPKVKATSESVGTNILTLRVLQAETGSSIYSVIPTLRRMAENKNNPLDVRAKLEELSEGARAIHDHSKAKAMLNILEAYDDKIIIFTQFRETLDFLQRTLDGAEYQTALFHGGLRRIEKEEHIERFKNEVKVLISTESGGEGRNLQFCNAMLNYDLPWNPMKIEQRVGRIHRVGQTRDVHIFNLSTRGTIEAYVLELLDAKINMFELVIGELDMILGNLDDNRPFEEIIMDILVESRSEEELDLMIQQFGEKLIRARQEYLRAKEYDGKLFGE